MSFEQQPFDAGDFVDNPEPRCPVVLLLDNSASMSGPKIDALNEGLRVFQEELSADSLAMKRVEVGIITFGPVKVQSDFTVATNFIAPHLAVEGNTPMGEAIVSAIDLLRARKERYRANGIQFYRPWIFMITDGAPTDDTREATRRISEGEAKKEFVFYSVAVEGADMDRLRQLCVRAAPLMLKGLSFRELFVWLSNSLGSVSRSNPGEAIALSNPTAPDGWATID